MATCARPGCSQPGAGALLLHRADRRAELLSLDDPVGERYGSLLCAEHLDRVKPPSGWTLLDNRAQRRAPRGVARPRRHGAPGSPTNPAPLWAPRRNSDDVPEEVASVSSPLLRRAFLGAPKSTGAPVEPPPEDDDEPGGEPTIGQLRLAV